MAKNKLIRIKPANEVYNTYGAQLGNSLYFALVASMDEVKDGLKYKTQLCPFLTCREQLTEVPRSFLHNKNTLGGYTFRQDLVDMTKLRLLMGTKTDRVMSEHTTEAGIKERLFSAKRILNILEEEANWPKSVISTVKNTKFDKTKEGFWLFTGCEHWIRVPQMLSLACLIFRLGYKFGPFEVDSIKDVNKVFKDLAKEIKEESRSSDKDYIAGVRKHIVNLMKNHDKLFNGKSTDYYVKPDEQNGGWDGYGGITSLMKCSTGNDKLHNRLKKYILNKK